MIKLCKICGKEFIANVQRKCCSSPCTKQNKKLIDATWRHSHPEYAQQYRKSRPDYKKTSKYRLWNRNYIRKYRKNHPTKNYSNREYHRKWRQNNKQRIKEYERKKRLSLSFNIKHILRSRLHDALKNNSKSIPTLELLGCSVKELKLHLESKFQPNMSWENYGYYGWHIDHIRPCCSFDLSKPEEQRKCFHYTNLQPLWAADNLRKGKTLLSD